MWVWMGDAREFAEQNVSRLRLPFLKPLVSDLALFWPERDIFE